MENQYGTITVATGTPLQRELKITDTVQAQFKDHRLVTVAEIEDGSYLVSVENPESTGRSNQKMWISKESFMAVFGTIAIYANCKGWDISREAIKSAEANGIGYHISENLKPFDKDEITTGHTEGSEGIEGSCPEQTGH